jgi:hypothetical protein
MRQGRAEYDNMAKRYRSVFILLGILAVLAGSYWLLTNLPQVGGDAGGALGVGDIGGAQGAAQPSPEDAVEFSPDKAPGDIVSLTISRAGEEYVIEQKTAEAAATDAGGSESATGATAWRLGNMEDFAASSSKLGGIASGFASLTSTKLVAEDTDDAGQFGFGGDGATMIRASFSDGTSTALEIGSKNPTNDGYYVRRAGESRIYLCSAYSAERFMIDKPAIADLAVLALNAEDIGGISLERGGEGVFAARKADDYGWEISSPIVAPLSSQVLGMILGGIEQLDATRFDEFGAEDLGKYGLDAPRYRLSLTLAGGGGAADEFGGAGSESVGADGGAGSESGSQAGGHEGYGEESGSQAGGAGAGGGTGEGAIELLMGNEAARGAAIYAMLGGTRDVFTLSLEKFGYLDKPLREIVDPFAYIVNISEVTHVVAEFDGRAVNCDIATDPDGDSDSDVFVVDGRDVSQLKNEKGSSYFREFYQAMIGAAVYDLDVGAEPSGDAEIAFTYALKGEPYAMKVEFVPKDDRLYYVVRNGEYAGVVVEKRKFDADGGLRATYSAMMEAARAAAA